MSANNEAKIDNLGLFNKVDKFESIEKNELGFKDYKLIPLKSDEIKYLKSIISTLEMDEDVYLCTRGDSKRNEDGKKSEHANFISKKLYNFFIVGDKAKFHINKPEKIFHHTLNNGNIIDDIKQLVLKCNEVLEKKSDRKKIGGKFPDQLISYIEKLHLKKQESWKFVLLAFLHNKGMDDYFKPYSGFVSLTYDQNKYNTARHFATNRYQKGVIYTYILRKDLKQYFKTEEMNNLLKEYDVKWYEDKHNEIMILNGLFPHNIIGFFEVDKNSTKRFILNYWFYQQIKHDLKCGYKFNYRNGVFIDQQDFQSAAKELGYNSFFTRSHVFDIVNGDSRPNIERGGNDD